MWAGRQALPQRCHCPAFRPWKACSPTSRSPTILPHSVPALQPQGGPECPSKYSLRPDPEPRHHGNSWDAAGEGQVPQEEGAPDTAPPGQ